MVRVSVTSNFKIGNSGCRGGALVFAMAAIAILAIIFVSFLRESQDDIAKKRLEAEQKASRLELLGEFEKLSTALKIAVGNCLLDSGESGSGDPILGDQATEGCPVTIDDLRIAAGLTSEQSIEVVCGGQRKGSQLDSDCTRDRSWLPKEFGIRLGQIKNDNYQSLRATTEIGLPSLNEFSRVFTNIGAQADDSGNFLRELTLAPTVLNSKLGVFFAPERLAETLDGVSEHTEGARINISDGTFEAKELLTNLPASDGESGDDACMNDPNYNGSCIPTVSAANPQNLDITEGISYNNDAPGIMETFINAHDEAKLNATHNFEGKIRNLDKGVYLGFEYAGGECKATIYEDIPVTQQQGGGNGN